MYLAFPADEKVKARLDAVCKSLNISLEEWFEAALIESEHDVMTKFLISNPEVNQHGYGVLTFVGLFEVVTLNNIKVSKIKRKCGKNYVFQYSR